MNNKKYDIYLVPNGRLADFLKGYTGGDYPDACQCWGAELSLDDCRARMRELAGENFRDNLDETCYSAICIAAEQAAEACGQFSEDKCREIGEAAADTALEIYVTKCVPNDADPTTWQIEWKYDLKWVMVRETPARKDDAEEEE